MTISSSTNKAQYTANGATTIFPYNFLIPSSQDIQVYLDEVLQSTGFTVSGYGNPAGGDVTFTTAPLSGVTVVILRVLPLTQTVDYVPYDAFPANTHEGALDKLTMIAQQQAEELARCYKGPIDTNTPPDPTDLTAANIDFVPSGGVASDNVQNAIQEVDQEKVNRAGDTMTGDLTFSGAGRRIKGDLSDATMANRLAVQTTVSDGNTNLAVIPNGASKQSSLQVMGDSNPAVAPVGSMRISSTEMTLRSEKNGSGDALPMAFIVGASEHMRIALDGKVTGTNIVAQMAKTAPVEGFSSRTLALADMGKCMDFGAASQTVLIPTNAAVAFPLGAIISFANMTGFVCNVNADTGVTLVVAGTSYNPKNAAVSNGGLATLIKVQPDRWMISGPGVT